MSTRWSSGRARGEDRQGLHGREPRNAQEFGSFDSNHLSIVREDGAMDLYDGGCGRRTRTATSSSIRVTTRSYLDFIAEEVRDWSYMKFPFINSIGPEKGWYRVGPLARVNNCDFIDTPEAEAARQEFMAVTDNKPNNLTLAYHWARMIETAALDREDRAIC
jgi:NAD-reducing hydrogenase large subunit